MGVLIDFQEAKAKLSAPTAISVDADLDDAVETFAFSQLEKRNRIALVLAGIFGGEAEQYLDKADVVSYYASTDFTVPFKAAAV